MADRPILFSAPMIRALLDGRKSQTRRILKPQPDPVVTCAGYFSDGMFGWMSGDPNDVDTWMFHGDFKTPIQNGDRLWVRETWQGLTFGDYRPTKHEPCEVRYFATDPCADLDAEARGYSWRPSIFMPRFASRLTLIVTDVRVERLQDISEADAIAEGVDLERYVPVSDAAGLHSCGEAEPTNPVEEYRNLWNSINGAGAWDENPWVAAYTFEVVKGSIDQIGGGA